MGSESVIYLVSPILRDKGRQYHESFQRRHWAVIFEGQIRRDNPHWLYGVFVIPDVSRTAYRALLLLGQKFQFTDFSELEIHSLKLTQKLWCFVKLRDRTNLNFSEGFQSRWLRCQTMRKSKTTFYAPTSKTSSSNVSKMQLSFRVLEPLKNSWHRHQTGNKTVLLLKNFLRRKLSEKKRF